MSTLNRLERLKLEKLLEMGSGYVLDFSNRTIADFVYEVLQLDFYDAKFTQGGTSKAKILRSIWDIEPDDVVAKLLRALIEYRQTRRLLDYRQSSEEDKQLLAECERVVARLDAASPQVDLTQIKGRGDDRNFAILAKSIRESIESNEPEAALDRLHTYLTRFVRELATFRGLSHDQAKPLHSLFGELVKTMRNSGEIESEMTDKILRFSIPLLDSFNDIRNNRSLAHDNRLLNYNEAILIYGNVASSIRFLEAIEQKRLTKAKCANADDVPF